MNATPLVPLALIGLIPLALALFGTLAPRRAAITVVVLAWLFLPMQGYSIPGLPDYTKVSATSLSVLLGIALFDTGRLFGFRPRWIDLPMLVYCLCPMASSLSNNLGFYDGLSAALNNTLFWGIPYLVGRLYCGDPEGIRDLAVAVFVGGLVYVPFCLFEIRFSPQLHRIVYGAHQHVFAQTIRFGGWRPTVFMQHGIAVAAWMTSASIAGAWLWQSGTLRQWRGISTAWLVAPLMVTTVLCKSVGSWALLAVGLAALYSTRWLRTSLAVLLLILLPVVYMTVRATGMWSGETAVDLAAEMINEKRAGSLQLRLDNENQLWRKALERPVFGWGGWGRVRVFNEEGKDISITDGLWIIVLGNTGLVGLCSITTALLLPPLMLWRRLRAGMWSHPAAAAAAVAAVLLTLHMYDNLHNAMLNPVFVMMAGGLAGLTSMFKVRPAAVAPIAAPGAVGPRGQFAGGVGARSTA